jgi:hypothetical protein
MLSPSFSRDHAQFHVARWYTPVTVGYTPFREDMRAEPISVQRVYAIGKPPANMMCLFAHLKNVVVVPTVGKDGTFQQANCELNRISGKRSLPSQLGGGDLDGYVDRCTGCAISDLSQ